VTGYQALREHAAWMDLSARGKIRATGEDRARLLHAMTTNHIERLTPGEGCYSFFLNAQGRILADANILCFEDSFLLDTEPETRQNLYEHLDRYIIADDVTLQDQTAQTATIGIEGPQAESVMRQLGAPIPKEPYSWAAWGDRVVARLSTVGLDGFFVLLPAGERDQFSAALTVPRADAAEERIVRIETARPRFGEEITDRRLIAETGLYHAVHLNKGCYLGQEIVERVRSRGEVHRLLREIVIDTGDPPAPGTRTDQLEIVSSAYSPAHQKTIAFAYVRTPFAAVGTELLVDGRHASVLNDPSTAPNRRET